MMVLFGMARYRRIPEVPLLSEAMDRKSCVLCKLFRRFCDAPHSPELPDWFKYPQGDRSYTGSDDDFVLQSKLEFLEHSSGSWKARDHRADVRIVSPNILDVDVAVDQVSSVLKSKFGTPEAVLNALDGCSVKVSEDLVDKILKRFSNDCMAAFGFFMWAGSQIGYDHPSDSYDMMVDILGKGKQFDKMWGLIEDMVRPGRMVSLATMTKVMRRLAGAGRWGEAIRTFHGLDHFGVKKDTVAMNVLLDTLCKERSVKHARDVFLELRRTIPPDASSFNSLVHGWCKARKLEEARQTMGEMREFGFNPCVITYTSLIEACCMEKNFLVVNAILDEMHAEGCHPNIVTYTIVMHALEKAKGSQEALKVYDKMKRDGCAPDASFYNSLIYILGTAGRLRDANDIFEEMCKRGISPNVTTYNSLISASCYHSQDANALRLLLKMEENFCRPDVKTYTPLLKLCCKRKWTKILLYLLAHMFKKDISLDLGTYTLLVRGLCRNGKVEHACFFFEEMVLKGLIPKHHTYDILMETLERKNMNRAKAKVKKLMLHVQSMRQTCHHAIDKHGTE